MRASRQLIEIRVDDYLSFFSRCFSFYRHKTRQQVYTFSPDRKGKSCGRELFSSAAFVRRDKELSINKVKQLKFRKGFVLFANPTIRWY